jgi:hypothetical protein
MNIYFGWTSPERDGDVADALRQSAAALADGQDIGSAAIYGNEALFGTPAEDV